MCVCVPIITKEKEIMILRGSKGSRGRDDGYIRGVGGR